VIADGLSLNKTIEGVERKMMDQPHLVGVMGND